MLAMVCIQFRPCVASRVLSKLSAISGLVPSRIVCHVSFRPVCILNDNSLRCVFFVIDMSAPRNPKWLSVEGNLTKAFFKVFLKTSKSCY